MDIIEAIKRDRWSHACPPTRILMEIEKRVSDASDREMILRAVCDEHNCSGRDLLDHLHMQRVMKRWGVDGVPEEPGMYWVRVSVSDDETACLIRLWISQGEIDSGVSSLGRAKFTHYLEVEQAPILPKDGE